MKKQPFEEENHLHQNLHFWVQNLHFPGWTWMGMNKKTATWWMKSLLGGSSHLVGTHGKGTYILTMVAITSYYISGMIPQVADGLLPSRHFLLVPNVSRCASCINAKPFSVTDTDLAKVRRHTAIPTVTSMEHPL